jgi:hypothetical protein
MVLASNVNIENGKKLIREKELQFLDDFDKIYSIYEKSDLPALCQIICDASVYKKSDPFQKDRKLKFIEFFNKEQNRAFDDIKFRLHLELIRRTAVVYPRSLRDLLRQMEGFEMKSEFELMEIAARIPIVITEYAFFIKTYKRSKLEKNISKIVQLYKQCTNENIIEIQTKCYELTN